MMMMMIRLLDKLFTKPSCLIFLKLFHVIAFFTFVISLDFLWGLLWDNLQ